MITFMFAIIWTGQNALYSIDPIQTREWACKITKGPLNPFVDRILRSLKVTWQQTEQSQATVQDLKLLGASASQIETQATERIYKDAPPAVLGPLTLVPLSPTLPTRHPQDYSDSYFQTVNIPINSEII